MAPSTVRRKDMGLRDEILAELERTPEYTRHSGLWDVVTTRIMEMIEAAVERGEIVGKDTLTLAFESWKKRQAEGLDIFGRPARPRAADKIIHVEPLPDGALPIYDKEPEG
jgi:hypothetical protein